MYSLVISYGCTLLIYYHCHYFNDCISFSNLGVQCLIITDLNTKAYFSPKRFHLVIPCLAHVPLCRHQDELSVISYMNRYL